MEPTTDRGRFAAAARLTTIGLMAVLGQACAVGPNYMRPEMAVPPSYRFAEAAQAASLATALRTPGVPPDALVRGVIAWTQLFGMISFELFGQFVGSFDPPDAFFGYAVAHFASFVGLGEPAN